MIKNILILEGGKNEEHEISISTSLEIQKIIKEFNYNFEILEVDPNNFKDKIKNYLNFDLYFNALHGPYGEDGSIQEILQSHNLKFTHSGVEASKNAFDKELTKKKIKETKVSFLDSLIFYKKDINKIIFTDFFESKGSFVLKPLASGSSYGVKIFQSLEKIELFFDNIIRELETYNKHEKLMLEPYILGKELTVSVFEENNISKSVAVTEILTQNDFFDYEAKYSKGFSKHILPAKIPSKIYNKCMKDAKIVHDTLECRGISRSDFLYDEKNQKLFFLEINTQPGLTPISLVPEQLKFKSIDFKKLIENLIKSSSE